MDTREAAAAVISKLRMRMVPSSLDIGRTGSSSSAMFTSAPEAEPTETPRSHLGLDDWAQLQRAALSDMARVCVHHVIVIILCIVSVGTLLS